MSMMEKFLQMMRSTLQSYMDETLEHMNEMKMKKKMTKAKIKKELQQMVRCKHQFDVTKKQPTAISTQQNK